jgi:hypothetical protein
MRDDGRRAMRPVPVERTALLDVARLGGLIAPRAEDGEGVLDIQNQKDRALHLGQLQKVRTFNARR